MTLKEQLLALWTLAPSCWDGYQSLPIAVCDQLKEHLDGTPLWREVSSLLKGIRAYEGSWIYIADENVRRVRALLAQADEEATAT